MNILHVHCELFFMSKMFSKKYEIRISVVRNNHWKFVFSLSPGLVYHEIPILHQPTIINILLNMSIQ